jgi:hypothetical protein
MNTLTLKTLCAKTLRGGNHNLKDLPVTLQNYMEKLNSWMAGECVCCKEPIFGFFGRLENGHSFFRPCTEDVVFCCEKCVNAFHRKCKFCKIPLSDDKICMEVKLNKYIFCEWCYENDERLGWEWTTTMDEMKKLLEP